MNVIEDKILELYSPIEVDIIDRDASSRPIPLQAADPERQQEYLNRIMHAFLQLQPQEDARNAFTAPEQDWSEICEKIISVTRTVRLVNGRPYGVYSCRSSEELEPEDVESLKWYCCDQWERGWGEGYAHCPREGSGLGLYIHFWHDADAPLLDKEQLPPIRNVDRGAVTIREITPDTFWTLIDQAKSACDQNQRACAYWLTKRLAAMGPEQALNFHSIMDGYMELADKYGLWTAAAVIYESDCYVTEFEGFRAWLIAQGRGTYLAALKDPDSLADVPDDDSCRFDELQYAGSMAYAQLTGGSVYDEIDPDAQRQLVADLRREIVYGEGIEYPYEWSEAAAYLPRLTAQYLTPKELRDFARQGHLWNHNDPDIQRARASAPKKKASTRKRKGGDAR